MFSDGWIALTLVHLVATWTMVGILLTIHFVHYPLFGFADPVRYAAFQSSHMTRITWVLVAPWGAEVLSAAALVVAAPTSGLRALAIVGFVGVVATVGITGLVAAPAHGRLQGGFDESVHRALLRADLVRTVVWLARGVIAVAIVWRTVT